MGNQSFFSPKYKTRTWAFLHAPPPVAARSRLVVAKFSWAYLGKLHGARGWHAKILYNSTFSSCYSLHSTLRPNIRLIFQYLTPSQAACLSSVFSFQFAVFAFHFSLLYVLVRMPFCVCLCVLLGNSLTFLF